MPKVTICIPTYNRSQYLAYAVNSVWQQTYSDFELIICDDASVDDTPEVVKQWRDDRLKYIRQPVNIGRSRNMRTGFTAAKGEYFLKFDDDDGITPDFLAKTVARLDNHPEVDFVCTNHWIIASDSQRMKDATQLNIAKWGKDKLSEGIIPDLIEQTFDYQSLQMGSTLFRLTSLQEVDYLRPQADGCEDFDLLVRLAIAGKTGYFLPELLMEYRFHQQQTSLKQDIHFLSAKAFCLNDYRFSTPELEKRRLVKLAQTQQALGLRLIEQGEVKQGRQLLNSSRDILGNSPKLYGSWLLSYLPNEITKSTLSFLRQLRPQNYTEQVRTASMS